MLEGLNTRCSICFTPATLHHGQDVREFLAYVRKCPRCGDYEITHEANVELQVALGGEGSNAGLLASYWMSWHLNERVTTKHIPMLRSLKEPSIVERAEALLTLVHWVSEGRMGKEIKLMVPRFCGATYCADEAELSHLIRFAVEEKGWVEEGGKPMSLKLTARGLSRLDGSDIMGQKTDQSTNISITNSTVVGSPIAAGQGVEQVVGNITITANDHEVLRTLAEAVRASDAPPHDKEDALLAIERIESSKDVAQTKRWYENLKSVGTVIKAIPTPVWETARDVFEKLSQG